jgi:hypothetical protein
MDAATVRSMLEQQFRDASDPEKSHEMYHDDAVGETIYVAEGFEPPEWRVQWRAAP